MIDGVFDSYPQTVKKTEPTKGDVDNTEIDVRSSQAWKRYNPPTEILDKAFKGNPLDVAEAIQHAFKAGYREGFGG